MHDMFADAGAFLRDWLGHQAQKNDIVGLAVAVYYKDTNVFNATYGQANIAGKKLTTQHLFNIGSVSKMLTAQAVTVLAQRGALSLNDRAVKYIPWLAQHRDGRSLGITVGQLLRHRSGLVRDGTLAGFWQLEEPFPDSADLKKLVLGSDIILNGYTQFKYSNVGYALLGQVIAAASGMSYDDFVKKEVLQPLGLEESIKPGSAAVYGVANGYTRRIDGKRQELPGFVPTHAFTAAAGWYATASDLCKFLAWQQRLAFSDPTTQDAAQPHWTIPEKRGTKYGSGFMLYSMDDRQLMGHGGGFLGHRSYAFYDPKSELSVVLLTNTKDAPLLMLARGVFDTLQFFMQNNTNPTNPLRRRFNATVENLWAPITIIATNKKIAVCNLDDFLPFLQAEELTPVGTNTLKITKAPDTGSVGEEVYFSYKNNQLEFINYAGQKLRPQKPL